MMLVFLKIFLAYKLQLITDGSFSAESARRDAFSKFGVWDHDSSTVILLDNDATRTFTIYEFTVR